MKLICFSLSNSPQGVQAFKKPPRQAGKKGLSVKRPKMAFVSASDWRAVNQTLPKFSSWEGNYRAWRRIGSGGLLDDRHKVGGYT